MENDLYFKSDEKLKRDLTGTCCGCLDRSNRITTKRDIFQTHYYRGNPEIYAEMLESCFSIQIKDLSGSELEEYVMCEVCVWKLREAAQFRTQLQLAQRAFKLFIELKKRTASIIFGPGKSKNSLLDDDNDDDDDDATGEFSEDDKSYFEDIEITDVISLSKKSPCGDGISKDRSLSSDNIKSKSLNQLECNTSLKGAQVSNKSTERPVKRKFPCHPYPYQLDENDLKCKICSEVFPYNKNLKAHMSIHYPNYICYVCAKPFSKKSQMTAHMTSVHQSKRYTCTTCHVEFKNRDSLKFHMLAHKGIRPERFKCPQCGIKFTTYLKRTQHLIKMHGSEKYKYVCKLCPKRFTYSHHLHAHVRRYHFSVKNHFCDICNYGFYSKLSLTRHMTVHTGEKNYKCTNCDKAYTSRFALNEHMRVHNNNVRRVVCPLCKRIFTQKGSLKVHLLKVHGEESINLESLEASKEQNNIFNMHAGASDTSNLLHCLPTLLYEPDKQVRNVDDEMNGSC